MSVTHLVFFSGLFLPAFCILCCFNGLIIRLQNKWYNLLLGLLMAGPTGIMILAPLIVYGDAFDIQSASMTSAKFWIINGVWIAHLLPGTYTFSRFSK